MQIDFDSIRKVTNEKQKKLSSLLCSLLWVTNISISKKQNYSISFFSPKNFSFSIVLLTMTRYFCLSTHLVGIFFILLIQMVAYSLIRANVICVNLLCAIHFIVTRLFLNAYSLIPMQSMYAFHYFFFSFCSLFADFPYFVTFLIHFWFCFRHFVRLELSF